MFIYIAIYVKAAWCLLKSHIVGLFCNAITISVDSKQY